MEKKKVTEGRNSLWTLLDSRHFVKSIFRRFNASQNNDFLGFTLIELLVVIIILAVLITLLIVTINPISQLQKARDGQKEYNLKQISSALDLYYSDNNQYPSSLIFGAPWKVGNTVYMSLVPEDPDCANGGSCYYYLADPSDQQWNVLFAKVYTPPNSSISCPLKNMIGCLPINYDASGYNYCIFSGKVNCGFVSVQTLPSNAGAGTGGGGSGGGLVTPTPTPTPVGSTPTPTPTPVGSTPTPTPVGVNCSPNSYNAVSNGLCNNVTSNWCTIYGGPLTCYSGPGTTACSGNLCSQ